MQEESMSIAELEQSRRGKKKQKEDKQPGKIVSDELTKEEIKEREAQAKVDFPPAADTTAVRDTATIGDTVQSVDEAEAKKPKKGQSAAAMESTGAFPTLSETSLQESELASLTDQSMSAERAAFITSVESFCDMHEQAARKARRRHIADSLVSIKGMLRQFVKLSDGISYWSES